MKTKAHYFSFCYSGGNSGTVQQGPGRVHQEPTGRSCCGCSAVDREATGAAGEGGDPESVHRPKELCARPSGRRGLPVRLRRVISGGAGHHGRGYCIRENALRIGAQNVSFVFVEPLHRKGDLIEDFSMTGFLFRFPCPPFSITEEQFWRNYFYRVSLICQAAELGTLGNEGPLVAQGSSEEPQDGN